MIVESGLIFPIYFVGYGKHVQKENLLVEGDYTTRHAPMMRMHVWVQVSNVLILPSACLAANLVPSRAASYRRRLRRKQAPSDETLTCRSP